MKDIYNVSLCKNGILGGLLYLKDEEMVFCTNKLTVPEHIRRLHMPYGEIERVEKAPWHTVLVSMKNGGSHRFLVFSRGRFLGRIAEKI